MNHKDELKAILVSALDTPKGTIYTVTGNEPGRRQLAIAALTSARRELLPDVPEMVNIRIQPVPNNNEEIAIIKIPTEEPIDV